MPTIFNLPLYTIFVKLLSCSKTLYWLEARNFFQLFWSLCTSLGPRTSVTSLNFSAVFAERNLLIRVLLILAYVKSAFVDLAMRNKYGHPWHCLQNAKFSVFVQKLGTMTEEGMLSYKSQAFVFLFSYLSVTIWNYQTIFYRSYNKYSESKFLPYCFG